MLHMEWIVLVNSGDTRTANTIIAVDRITKPPALVDECTELITP
jgi:hypothetical protein